LSSASLAFSVVRKRSVSATEDAFIVGTPVVW
jgi:hypothetical protein